MASHALLDPAVGGNCIEIACVLRLARGVARDVRPDERSDRVVAPSPHEIPDDVAVFQRDRPACALGVPLGLDLSAEVVDRGQQRLDQPVRRVALGEQRCCAVQVLVGEGANLDRSHDARTIALARCRRR